MRYSTTIQTRRRGLTLVELITAMALVGVLTVVVGTLLVSSNKHWNALFNKVYRQETTDSFAAHRVFDSVCRKSSYRKAILGQDNASLELYYWDTDSASETPDNYARFYLLDSDVMVEYGKNKPETWTPDSDQPTRSIVVASRIDRVHFEVQGASVQMILYYADAKAGSSICSSMRYNY